MWLRYPLAAAVSYATFLLLLGIAIAWATRRLNAHRDGLRRDSQRHQYFSEDNGRRELGDVFDEFFDRSSDEFNRNPDSSGGFLIFLLAATVVLICVYFICVAPAFLAELIVEGACLSWLFQPRDRTGPNQWRAVALEQTALPALTMALCLMTIGIGLQMAAPGAETVVDACRKIAENCHVAAVQNDRLR